jgi:hypothetical protein
MKKLPTRKEAKKWLEKAKAQKLEVPEEARKLLTETAIKLFNMKLVDKDDLDDYLYLTKASARAIAQKK